MDRQVLKPWIIPIIDSKCIFNVEAIHDDVEGFRILLRDNQTISRVLKISFNDRLSYRNTYESYLLDVWSTMETDVVGKTFYLISNSNYLDYFNKITFEIYKDWKITHYAIYTTSDCIDILSIQPPTIEWLV